ncbi:hypothetical protein NQZ68_009256 [Dissostichus eleginoides]|nr:hypothetical protein NQZ68_009256 [Dissostichus eleginoides]
MDKWKEGYRIIEKEKKRVNKVKYSGVKLIHPPANGKMSGMYYYGTAWSHVPYLPLWVSCSIKEEDLVTNV